MGLLRTAARAAVATRVVGSTHRRQQQRWAAQDVAQTQPGAAAEPQPVPITESSPSANMDAVIEQLTQLGKLRDAGILSEAEFELQKHKILSSS